MVNKKSRSRTEYLVKAKSQFKERSTATNVEILLPLPADAITPTVRASQVGAAYCRGRQLLLQAGQCAMLCRGLLHKWLSTMRLWKDSTV